MSEWLPSGTYDPPRARSMSDMCVPRPWHKLSAWYDVWSRNVPVSKYAGKRGGNGAANSGTDLIINERLCVFAQVLLLISS